MNPAAEVLYEVRGAVAVITINRPERLNAFRMKTINRCRLVEPSINTAWLTTEVPADAVEIVSNFGHKALHPYWEHVDEALVRSCHEHGVEVNVWTCDDPEAMRRLAAWGVDGICTNVPDPARAQAAVMSRAA